jgi:hypothetical protein
MPLPRYLAILGAVLFAAGLTALALTVLEPWALAPLGLVAALGALWLRRKP